ncbi:intercompartmental signaling factor BofC [Geobacillus sp. FSL K6-0789]|uniref:Forespore regulator of the sigma-K checkpoint, BofC n=1 Tax=Geobacillus stearothermophilus TaxID=1422 RepID=A0A3L7DH41_GEOSE|nr:intercompartmental signaling factor BofC [Geobacillus stearothermophilus]KMY61598.1 Forespore regulator of the sigma-K checkpoint, BofC [Geobacillus stearothermophilus]KMY64297.1 Forespore regulator of the sigma-K checkpoint, BofC [Geobacillus stearothermophilus]RLQ10436.1 Forespore regulator of the sigma-K checkpoint, BofC [Geobacillus stearothermophilus]RLQ12221.1 Forespore regulator of the sigma-K checkpoint, BofC [Geobacillus stearothermophilus]RLQ15091.1 Forespore regulator of the sigm
MRILSTLLLAVAAVLPVHGVSAAPVKMTIVLQQHYLDGEMSEEKVTETVDSLTEIWKKYRDWQLINLDDRTIVFRKTVNDISPLLKTNGYFGITDDGTLSIFNGKPGRSSEIIQSFFQIDVQKLESRQQEKLKKGIRVLSKERYEQVIEMYRHFAVVQ